MMLSRAILLFFAALTSITVSTATARDPNDTMPVFLGHRDKPIPVDKPTLNPPVLDISEYLVKQLKHQTVNVVKMWNDSKINYACKKIFTKEGYKVKDIEMFEVEYQDCYEKPWVMCRHKDAWYQPDLMNFYIGLIPVNMRRFNRHFIALPADDKGGRDTYNDYDTIVWKGQASLHNIIAESARSMGQYVGGGFGIWSSGTLMWSDQTWEDLVENNATAVMNPTSQISLEETFTQTMVLALAELSGIPLASFIPEYKKISKVVFTLWESFMWVLTANDQVFCQERILEDSPVGLPGQLPDVEV
ncbi:hypothetical protein J4E93_004846 [Alternaria ventricosa]|uniref:uncharacterized protein n=1 Tax=Alternaria ventricosa TaxID=1187951 RepID=UPI0020C34C8C|nr:uncharacterized protein J4E93_004846 [Alternaria ventricosa]KAI4646625.1 hypothetical protein J4E93_004846 [Alternaria ventricosa]